MADRHLNLFYSYNRDNELIENNLTRAFIVFLSIISGKTRHRVLSSLLERSRRPINNPVGAEDLDFTNPSFALQSNIERHIPNNSDRKILLTIATEPLDISSTVSATDVESTDEGENNSGSSSIPDAWVYDIDQGYCILIEVKAGSYPLSAGQLEAHAADWFGFSRRGSLQELDSRDSLGSVTWIDVLETLRDTSKNHADIDSAEERLLWRMGEFVSYFGYHVFNGFDFSGLHAPPDLVISHSPQQGGT